MHWHNAGRKTMDNEFNTFEAGVEPGGLRNSTQIKILVIFLAGSVNEPLEESVITDALQVHGIANYFDITDAIVELTENGTLAKENGAVSLTEKGRTALRALSDELPLSVKETALADTVNLHILQKNEKENSVEITKCDGGYNVNFGVIHDGCALMKLTLYAADIEQAQLLKENFLKDPSRIYSSVVSALYV